MADRLRCETTSDPAAFWVQVSDFLLRDPVVNNVLITNVISRRDGAITDPAPATYAAALDRDGAVAGAAMRTPPFSIALSSMPAPAVEPLAEALAERCPDAGGVMGTAAEAGAFAAAWARLTGSTPLVQMRQRLFRLDAVTMPPAPPGGWRVAGPGERDLLVAWTEVFEVEAGSGATGTAGQSVDMRLAGGRAFVWVDGAAVSFLGTTAPASGVVRVGPVYTPPDRRRRGYASALVAAVSQHALDAGAALCTLYTDLANPTSNKIYAAVGYRPVSEVTAYSFSPPPFQRPAMAARGTSAG